MNDSQRAVEAFIDEGLVEEQRNAVRAAERVVVVRACPGAGKTRVFAARFAREVANWRGHRGGVAALSFTNVAQREVKRRVLGLRIPSGYPHFIGTIDAFLLRFVVCRFGGDQVRLSRFRRPYDVGDYSIQRSDHRFGPGKADIGRLSEFMFLSQGQGEAGLFIQRKEGGMVPVPDAYSKEVLAAKQRVWLADGHLTYADVCAVAWKALQKQEVREIVASRFPVILVDEFQDTTGLRAPCLRLLFEEGTFERGFVVGDPDQRIMSFAGAPKGIFEEFTGLPGARRYELRTCHRAHSRLAKVASLLRRADEAVVSGPSAPPPAPVVLATHAFGPRSGDLTAVGTAFVQVVRATGIKTSEAVVLAWADSVVRRLGGDGGVRCPFTAHDVRACLHAVERRRRGDLVAGIEVLGGVAGRIVFEDRQPSEVDLAARGLTLRAWRRELLGILDDVDPRGDETVADWLKRLKRSFELLGEKVLGERPKLGRRFSARLERGRKAVSELGKSARELLPLGESSHPWTTARIHQVKGEEFSAVCVFIPTPPKGDPGALPTLLGLGEPSVVKEAEEARRVAYVGITRATRLLLLVVPEAWRGELASSPEGLALLDAFENSGPLSLESIGKEGWVAAECGADAPSVPPVAVFSGAGAYGPSQ